MAQHAHGKAVQNLIDRGIPVRARARRGDHLPSVAKEREVSQSILKTWIEQHKKETA